MWVYNIECEGECIESVCSYPDTACDANCSVTGEPLYVLELALLLLWMFAQMMEKS